MDNFCGLAHLEAFAFQHGGYLWAEGQTCNIVARYVFIRRMHRVGEEGIHRIHGKRQTSARQWSMGYGTWAVGVR